MTGEEKWAAAVAVVLFILSFSDLIFHFFQRIFSS